MANATKLATLPANQSADYYQGDDLMTVHNVAAWLKVKKSWVFEQTRARHKVRGNNPLPHCRMGKYLRFSRMRIAEWLAENST